MEDLELWLEGLPSIPVDEQWKTRFSSQLRARQGVGQAAWGGLVLGVMVLLGWGAQNAYQKLRPREGALPKSVFHVKVVQPVELDGKSRAEILDMRRAALKELPELGPLWRPLQGLDERQTWKEIGDGKRWTGVQGQLESSSEDFGKRFHEGASMESFFVLNPLVLIGLESDYVAQHNATPGKLTGALHELVCDSVTLDGFNQRIELTYKIGKDSPFRDLLAEGKPSHFLNLINAGEMDYNWYAFESFSGFDNLKPEPVYQCNQFYKPLPVQHGTEVTNQLFIRTVGFAPMRLASVPAQLRLKLWRLHPEKPEGPADLTEVINVVE